ncbi:hypothetical protein [Fulvivirga ligni]|uniref:hypothetical protein n=1 Tax=Fulvivirga ligni TaxID=2904246 RepID=UPI001F3DF532|nr:hypothetical protein [Fulvivirga ligni]UII22642.1 hypothetical protein LVD16_05305 [Fulvivirga ligni]
MKKSISVIIFLLSVFSTVLAQTPINGTSDVYYNNGNLGIGTSAPEKKLHIQGDVVIEGTNNPRIYTGVGTDELNRYIQFQNSPEYTSASGVKAGGILISDSYNYANPGKNDLIVKGYIGVGTARPLSKLDIRGNILLDNSESPVIYTGSEDAELNRFLKIINSPDFTSASGLKAGGMLVADQFSFANPGKNDLIVKGKVGIGTAVPGSYKLAVEGKIGAREINVQTGSWADYVFEEEYSLTPLSELKNYIHINKHLPGIPTSSEVAANGVDLGEMNKKLLEKVEELTLYIIQQSEEIKELKSEVKEMRNEK